ncbi:MAG: NUDIX domain-containing protein [Candidatus Thorarchaeota archaeon]|nr:NUDIX domain-containing protein [Candidatus Thorarchaeota archaeon]
MTKMVPIAITLLRCGERYLFLQRRNPPYENLWSMVGGKVGLGEHIRSAAVREVMEETGTPEVNNYMYRGLVSERLLESDGALSAHFLIFVSYAEIPSFSENHQEGNLALFTEDEIESKKEQFLPSDYQMFKCFKDQESIQSNYEAELLHDDTGYHLIYYRESSDEAR